MLRRSRLCRPNTSIVFRAPRCTRLSRLSTSVEQTKAEQNPPFPSNPRMIFVRPWDVPFNITHVFGIVRHIERSFGSIDDIIVPRDSDIPSNYGPYFIVQFSWEEDAQAIPPEGKVIQVPSPDVSEHQPGGIGLSDLEPYLNASFRERNLQPAEEDIDSDPNPDAPKNKLMDVKLERARLQHTPSILEYSFKHRKRNPYSNKSSSEAQNLALAIVNFGGFLNPPLPLGALPSSFSRIVESWYNIMTSDTRQKLIKQDQTRQSAEQAEDQYSNIRSEVDVEPGSISPDLENPNDAIIESADELVLVPESASAIASPGISDVAPDLQELTSTSSLSKQHKAAPAPPSVTHELFRIEEREEHEILTIPHGNLTPEKAPSEIHSPVPSRQSTPSQSQVSKMSKHERMLLAVREAGKADVMRARALQENLKSMNPDQDNVTTESIPILDEPNNKAAKRSNLWSFLLGGNT